MPWDRGGIALTAEEAMGHQPYPNAERTRRYVDARHGSSCPRCGHRSSVHPYRKGQFVCTRSRDQMPSCRECVALLVHLENSPLRGLAQSVVRMQLNVPPLNITPGRAVIGGAVSVNAVDNSTSVAEAVRRNLITIDRANRR